MTALRSPLLAALSLSVLALAACGRGDEGAAPPPASQDKAAPETPAAPEEPATDVIVADTLASLIAPAEGIAFWIHPTLPFESRAVVAAGKDGLLLVTLDGERADAITGAFTSGAALAYAGTGQDAEALVAAYDEGRTAYRFFGVRPDGAAFTSRGGEIAADSVAGFCLAPATDGFVLYDLRLRAAYAHRLTLADGAVTAQAPHKLRAPGPLVSCAAAPDAGEVLFLAADGAVYAAPVGDDPDFGAPLMRADGGKAVSIGVLMQKEGAGAIALLDGPSGRISLFSRDGQPLGVVHLASNGDIASVGAASVLGVGSANFGGLYRSGILVAGSATAPYEVRAAPWVGVANMVNLPLHEPVDARDPGAPVSAPPSFDAGPITPPPAPPGVGDPE